MSETEKQALLKEGVDPIITTRQLSAYSNTGWQFSPCDDKWVQLCESRGCREGFLGNYGSYHVSVSRDKYLMSTAYVRPVNGVSPYSADCKARLERSLQLLHILEKAFGFELTRATIYEGAERLIAGIVNTEKHRALIVANRAVPTYVAVEVDDIWTSVPPLLSLHALFMRVTRTDSFYRSRFSDLEGFKKFVAENVTIGTSGDAGYFRNFKAWLQILGNLNTVFGDRNFSQSWSYQGFSGYHGIASFLNGSALPLPWRKAIRELQAAESIRQRKLEEAVATQYTEAQAEGAAFFGVDAGNVAVGPVSNTGTQTVRISPRKRDRYGRFC